MIYEGEDPVRVEDSQPWKPKPYMKKAVRWMIERGAAGLFLDPG